MRESIASGEEGRFMKGINLDDCVMTPDEEALVRSGECPRCCGVLTPVSHLGSTVSSGCGCGHIWMMQADGCDAIAEDIPVIEHGREDLRIVIVGAGISGILGSAYRARRDSLYRKLLSLEISMEELMSVDAFMESLDEDWQKIHCLNTDWLNAAPVKNPAGKEWIEQKKRAHKKTGIKAAKRAAKRGRGK